MSLTKITSTKVKFKWTKIEQNSFDAINLVVACNTLLNHPNFNEEFKIYIDAVKLQLGAVISQNDELIAFYSSKLTDAQNNCTVIERGILSIIQTLKEFRTILVVQRLIIYTVHKNPTCNNFNTNRVLRCRIKIDEYVLEI